MCNLVYNLDNGLVFMALLINRWNDFANNIDEHCITQQNLIFIHENLAIKEDHTKHITKNTKPVEEHSSWWKEQGPRWEDQIQKSISKNGSRSFNTYVRYVITIIKLSPNKDVLLC